MNGVGTRKASHPLGYDPRYGDAAQASFRSKSTINSYQGDLDGQIHSLQSHDQANSMRHSTMLNPNDPVSMHLLMEHALGDSERYQVFSFEETEDLKRELPLLSTRIDATKRKLAIETKIRDAAKSVNRLDSSSNREDIRETGGQSHRRNLLSKGSGSDILGKSNDEVAASAKNCEDLSQELRQMEKRREEVQRLLLEHTAGVLQMTHKGYLEKEGSQSTGAHAYLNGFNDLGVFDPGFDDRSFYQTLDSMLESGGQSQNTADFTRQSQAILTTQQRLWDLNRRLQDAIAQASSNRSAPQAPPDLTSKDGIDIEESLFSQIEYLEFGLEQIQMSQLESVQSLEKSERATEERLEDLNKHLRDIVVQGAQQANSHIPLPPQASGRGSDEQIAFLQGGLNALEQDVRKLRNNAQASHTRSRSHEEKVDRYESTFHGLWHKIVAEEERVRGFDEQESAPKEKFSIDAFASKVELLNTRATGLQEQKDILSRQIQQQREINNKSDSEKDARFDSLSQELEQSKRNLDAANTELRSQVAASQANQAQLQQELEQSKRNLEAADAELHSQVAASQANQTQLQQELEQSKRNLEAADAELQSQVAASQANQAQLQQELEQSKRNLEAANTELQSQVAASQAHQAQLEQELQHTREHQQNLEGQAASRTTEVDKVRNEMQELEGELVRLQTELTVSRAELDGAYGTRAQRAAEVAQHPALIAEVAELKEQLASVTSRHDNTNNDNSDLTQRVQMLQKELSETIGEYEVMTKSSIEFEKERETLESNIDGLRDKCEALETDLSDEKVRWMGMKSPGVAGDRNSNEKGATSTAVLKNEFKKMMRETRAEHMKMLRHEQDERRKLEAQLRASKKDQTPGKSSLSQSMTAS